VVQTLPLFEILCPLRVSLASRMNRSATNLHVIHFGEFEVDLHTGELRKNRRPPHRKVIPSDQSVAYPSTVDGKRARVPPCCQVTRAALNRNEEYLSINRHVLSNGRKEPAGDPSPLNLPYS
jgi:hypothetical protein